MVVNAETLQFACSRCGIELTVPAHLAGVEGPCPHCGESIRSPRLPEPPTPEDWDTADSIPAPEPARPPLVQLATRPRSVAPAPRSLPPRRLEGGRADRFAAASSSRRAISPATGLSARYAEKKELRDLLRITIAVLGTLIVVAVVVALVRQ